MEILLKAIQHYIPLSADDEAIIRALFRVQKLQKGELLLQAGKVCKNIFFVEQGLVRYYTIIDGEERTSYFNKEGEFVCEYASFLPQRPSIINIQALEPCTPKIAMYYTVQLLLLLAIMVLAVFKFN